MKLSVCLRTQTESFAFQVPWELIFPLRLPLELLSLKLFPLKLPLDRPLPKACSIEIAFGAPLSIEIAVGDRFP